MDSQKQFTGPEIQFLLSCSEADENEMINCEEFANRFQEPARDIGFNVAVLLTNLSEHVPHDPRLRNFLELAESILEYFRPYLGRIEIMGASRRIERIYFEISETNRTQWEMPQVGGPAHVHARLPRFGARSSHAWAPRRGCPLCAPAVRALGGPSLRPCKPRPAPCTHVMGPTVPLHVPGSPHLLQIYPSLMQQHRCALTGCLNTMPATCTPTLGALACPYSSVATTPTPSHTGTHWLYLVIHPLLIRPAAPGVPSLGCGLPMPSLLYTHLGGSGVPCYAGLPLTSQHMGLQMLSKVLAHDIHFFGVHSWVYIPCTLTLKIQSWHTTWLSTPH